MSSGLFFLDSGAFTLYAKHTGGGRDYAYYDTPEFWAYVDGYAAFIKSNIGCIDYYANVDVMGDSKRSWKVLKYLEGEHDLSPVPVVHFEADLKWLDRHVEAGYDFIGLGGLASVGSSAQGRRWLDAVFTHLCPAPKHLPVVRLHGFAVTAYDLMVRYPWWSVDSASWAKMGALGSVMVPHRRRGVFDFSEQPYVIGTSHESVNDAKHYLRQPAAVRAVVDDWLRQIGVPLGRVEGGEVLEEGVLTRHTERKIANLLFFEALCKWLPEYPWVFRPAGRKRGFL